MKTTSIILLGLFLAQIAAAGVLYLTASSQRAVRPEGSLLALEEATPDAIEITGESRSITLEKKDNRWIIASNSLPVDQSKIDAALESLSELQLGWAVATSDSSHQQLEVAQDNFQRRVELKQGGDVLGDLYLGTSPGFRRTHARKSGEDEVYSVAVNTYDLPDSADGWFDRSLLQVGDVSKVVIGENTLTKNEESWVFNGNEATDQDKAGSLIDAFESMRVLGVVEEGVDTANGTEVVVTAADTEFEYRFAENDSRYLVSRSDISATFSIVKSSYDNILETQLLLPETESIPEAESVDEEKSPEAGAVENSDVDSNANETAETGPVETKE